MAVELLPENRNGDPCHGTVTILMGLAESGCGTAVARRVKRLFDCSHRNSRALHMY